MCADVTCRIHDARQLVAIAMRAPTTEEYKEKHSSAKEFITITSTESCSYFIRMHLRIVSLVLAFISFAGAATLPSVAVKEPDCEWGLFSTLVIPNANIDP